MEEPAEVDFALGGLTLAMGIILGSTGSGTAAPEVAVTFPLKFLGLLGLCFIDGLLLLNLLFCSCLRLSFLADCTIAEGEEDGRRPWMLDNLLCCLMRLNADTLEDDGRRDDGGGLDLDGLEGEEGRCGFKGAFALNGAN